MLSSSRDMCYIAISKGDSMELNLKFVSEIKLVSLILFLFAMLACLSANAENVEAITNESEIAPHAQSNLSSTEKASPCPGTYRLDEESGLCISEYTYCPDGTTLESALAECDSSRVENTTSENGFPNNTLANFTSSGPG